MKNRMIIIKKAIMIIVAVLAAAVILLRVDRIMSYKYNDGIYSMERFYAQDEGTVDVLVLGSSHAFENINTSVLWERYGISSYVLGSSYQPMNISYYCFREALKYQRPKLVILEAFMSCNKIGGVQGSDDDVVMIKGLFGMRWSGDKLEAVLESTSEEKRPAFLLEYTNYHDRYRELNRSDFIKEKGDPLFAGWKGFGNNLETESFENDQPLTTQRRDLPPETEDYYRKILELAKREGIPLLVVTAPFPTVAEKEIAVFNRACDIAGEYGCGAIEYNSLVNELGIDYHTDAADGAHLNYLGNVKLTEHLADYIHREYDLPDHRGDERYASWELDLQYNRQKIYDKELNDTSDPEKIAQLLGNPEYVIFVADRGDGKYSDSLREVLKRDASASDLYYITYRDGEAVLTLCTDKPVYYSDAYNDLCILKRKDEEGISPHFYFNQQEYDLTDGELNIFIYDKVKGSEPIKIKIEKSDKGER